MWALPIPDRGLGALLSLLILLPAAGQLVIPTGACRTVPTTEILGYYINTSQPVYRVECSGSCNVTKDTRTCQARYRNITIQTLPTWQDVAISISDGIAIPTNSSQPPTVNGLSALTTVRLVTKCDCLPAPCLIKGGMSSVPHNAIAYNDCGDRCRCRYGNLTECCRIRKSVTHMPFAERKRYIQAHRDISSGVYGATLKSQYDALIADHTTFFYSGIHTGPWFLPWHRSYILLFENLLRNVDCRITVPYWASELYYTDPWNSILWSSSSNWYGGGISSNCVPDGAFTSPWTLTPSASNDCLRRERSGSVPSPIDWTTLLTTPANSFTDFRNTLEFYHNSVHCAIGGTMCNVIAANAPEFFLWHGQIDRQWYKWQSQSQAHALSYGPAVPQTDIMAPGSMAGGRPVSNFLNPSSQGDNMVCVMYREPPPSALATKVVNALAKLPQSLLMSTPSASCSALVAQAREWKQIVSKASGYKTFQELDAGMLAEMRGRPVSSVGSNFELGADLSEIRDALYDLHLNYTESTTGFAPQAQQMANLQEALDALQEFELQKNGQLYEDENKCQPSSNY